MSLVLKKDLQHILRVLNTNVDVKKIMFALTSIKAIGRRFANICCKKAEIDMNKRAGELSAAEREWWQILGSSRSSITVRMRKAQKEDRILRTGSVPALSWTELDVTELAEMLSKLSPSAEEFIPSSAWIKLSTDGRIFYYRANAKDSSSDGSSKSQSYCSDPAKGSTCTDQGRPSPPVARRSRPLPSPIKKGFRRHVLGILTAPGAQYLRGSDQEIDLKTLTCSDRPSLQFFDPTRL